MSIPVGIAFIIAFFAGFAYFGRRFLGDLYLERAIVLGPLTGLIMGDLQTGLIVGGTLELIFMGASDIGGSVPANLPIGSTIGTAFAIAGKLTPEAALAIAVPAAIAGSFFELLAKTVSTIFVAGAEYFADRGNSNGVSLMVHLGNFLHFLADFLPVFLVLSLGGEMAKNLANLPGWLSSGIKLAGNMLPALGFGILLSVLATPSLIAWFFIGFLLAIFAKFSVLGAAFVGICAGAIFILQKGALTFIRPAEQAEKELSTLVTPADRRTIFWRSFGLQSAFSFDRMQALGFTWTLIPFLKKLYGNTAEFGKALRRHLVFFNTHMWIPGPIFAMVADLEARRAQDPTKVEEQSIQAVKGSLMGPLAGIGDSMFHGTLRPLMGGVSASLALQGIPIAPLLFLVVTNAVHVAVRWFSQDYGFRLGGNLFERVDQAGLRRVMEGSAIAGLMALGALVANWLSFGLAKTVTYTVENYSLPIQSMLDSILPGLLPLLTTLLVYWAVRKGVKNTWIMIILLVISIVFGGIIKVFA
jgi:fructoselysine/glucoselysine PTS system EIID component